MALLLPIQLSAQSAFFFTHARVSTALNRYSLRVSEQAVRQQHRPAETSRNQHRPVQTRKSARVSSPLFGLLDVGVDEEAVHLRVDVLHGDLETVETPGLRHLHFLCEALHLVVTE